MEKFRKGMTSGDVKAAIAEYQNAFVRTPNLREKVIALVDKAVAKGWTLEPGTYVDDEMGQVCALGAIGVGLRTQGPTGEQDHELEDIGLPIFALTKNALGCSPIEIDSIEAGFECYDWKPEQGGHQEGGFEAMAPYNMFYDKVAYNIGKEIRLEYVNDICEEDYNDKELLAGWNMNILTNNYPELFEGCDED